MNNKNCSYCKYSIITTILFFVLFTPNFAFAKIKAGIYTCYTGDKISKFTLSSEETDMNLLYEKNNKRYKGVWNNSFNDAEMTLYVKRITSYSSSKPITIEYLLSPSFNGDPSQFIIHKMIRGKKRLFCYATGILEAIKKVKEKPSVQQQIIINNNYISKEK